MEIAQLTKTGLRIKGKNALLSVDPAEKFESNAALLLTKDDTGMNLVDPEIVINGPGEYETGGIKITGIRQEDTIVYNLNVDSVTVLLGKATSLEKIHTKLKEANILIVNCDSIVDATFFSGLVTNVVIFYGEKSVDVCKAFGQDNVKNLPKYTTTVDKLPTEVETVILE